ncbi:hypothetical protein BKH43_03340 [Helicobacter sp. 13S00401-1]|uniref:hypothetical protein n=1 Tax=Helicobacter sp. 13S00401-1 TaxID=1905758 RepID=UPI000BA6DF3D|nr:hypothetical protein [Helicobacter sp. 13S00401-1]PAF50904.1 hypothetical protein BKH43_03340 [Helicobacter sp. 13S00401-1]
MKFRKIGILLNLVGVLIIIVLLIALVFSYFYVSHRSETTINAKLHEAKLKLKSKHIDLKYQPFKCSGFRNIECASKGISLAFDNQMLSSKDISLQTKRDSTDLNMLLDFKLSSVLNATQSNKVALAALKTLQPKHVTCKINFGAQDSVGTMKCDLLEGGIQSIIDSKVVFKQNFDNLVDAFSTINQNTPFSFEFAFNVINPSDFLAKFDSNALDYERALGNSEDPKTIKAAYTKSIQNGIDAMVFLAQVTGVLDEGSTQAFKDFFNSSGLTLKVKSKQDVNLAFFNFDKHDLAAKATLFDWSIKDN